MLQGWFVVVVALGYIGLLFVVASYGDRLRSRVRDGRSRMLIYPLSLAIYCTSWTFFGSVGLASRTGYDFITIYVGPILMIGLGWPLIVRIVRLAKAQNITSIADFIAARYGKHQAVATTVALIAMLGTILAHIEASTGAAQPELGDIALFVALAMAGFAVLFGTRHIDATEHQDGLILAIATESIVKLFAFLAVGVFVTFVMLNGPADPFADRPDVAVLCGEQPLAAPVPRRRRREQQRGRGPARRLAVPALPGADQPVRGADRGGRPAELPARRGRQRHVRARPAAGRRLGRAGVRRLHRRAVGGDRHGDRRMRRARHHGVERHRGADGAQAARILHLRIEGRGPHAADHSAARHLFHPVPRLSLLPLLGRGATRLDRPAVVRGHRPAGAGLLRRADLAPRHRARRDRRHDGGGPGVGLYAAAAELRRRRPDRPQRRRRRAVGHRDASPAGPARAAAAAAGARPDLEPHAQRARLRGVLAASPAGPDRAAAGEIGRA